MNILLVNDDGISSPDLALLCRAVKARGHHVTVCAPATQQSAKSHAFTIMDPLLVRPYAMEGADEAWALVGTPVDCCRVGMMALCDEKPDLVMSGINFGYNIGLATYVSGTVGAAREAAFQGIPAIAVSRDVNMPEETVRFFADYAVRLGEKLVDYPAPEMSVCNVNVPPLDVHALKEAVMCPISHGVYKDGYEERTSPRDVRYFWLTPEIEDDHPVPGTDADMLQRGHITVTFLTVDGCGQSEFADFPEAIQK